jgi:5-formyltetrahydrofolate cyclo-ligase
MNTDIIAAKEEMRASVRALLKQVPGAERKAASGLACELVLQQSIWRNARAILFYSPLKDELDLSPLWKVAWAERRIVTLPRFCPVENQYVVCRLENSSHSLLRGQFGIVEPAPDSPSFPLNQLDLVFVPGVAFDLNGRRLGRGKGFYDRLLRPICGIRCGVAFDQQIQLEVPAEPHDIHLNCILTPTRWLDCGQSPDL